MLQRKISVIGLGYVGLPVAVSFGQKGSVIGLDINTERLAELDKGFDRTCEVDKATLKSVDILYTKNPDDLKKADFHIVTVPTPINEAKQPDLALLYAASITLGKQLKKGDIVVYESTVYPGVTEEECIPLLETHSGLRCGVDFAVGYSPERINPGDKEHTFTKIKKVVSGSDAETLDIVADTYGAVVTAGIHRAASIKVAEAAKVIENTQRDLNIALMNELAIIFKKMNIDTHDVLEAACTKWNFLPFKPGLVGGHCIGVDPYYLTHKAMRLGYDPQVIMAGRRINDSMGKYIAEQTIKHLILQGKKIRGIKIAVLGVTFKEDCPDLRNSKAFDVIRELQTYNADLFVHDPLANPKEARHEYDVALDSWDNFSKVDAIIINVGHRFYQELSADDLRAHLNPDGCLVDVKSILNPADFSGDELTLWRL